MKLVLFLLVVTTAAFGQQPERRNAPPRGVYERAGDPVFQDSSQTERRLLTLVSSPAELTNSRSARVQYDGQTWLRKQGTISTATPGYGGVLLPGSRGFYYERQWFGRINIRWFGAKGDSLTNDAPAFQRAFDFYKSSGGAAELYVPTGRYVLKDRIVYATKGYAPGLKLAGEGREQTILYFNFANGEALFDLDGSSQQPYQYQFNGYITGLHITTNQAYPPRSQGAAIRVNGWWGGTIANNVIRRLHGDGLAFPLRPDIFPNTDGYQIALLRIDQNELTNLDGVGIHGAMGLGFSSVDITRNRIGLCQQGGIVAGGHYVRIQNNTIFSNGTPDGEPRPGVWIQRQNGSTGNGLVIENNEFDSNVDCHLLLEGCVGGRVDQNRFLAWETTWNKNRLMPGTAIKFRTSIGGAKNTKITLSTNTFRAQHRATGAGQDWESIWFDFGNDPNNSDVVVDDWEVNEAGPNVVDYTGLNPNSRVKIYKASRLVQSPQQTPQFSGRITRNQPLGTTATGNLLFETVNDPQHRYDEAGGEFVAPYGGHYTVAFGVTLSGAQPGQKIVLLVKAGDTIARQKVVYASGKGEEYFDFGTTVYGAAGAKYNVQVYGTGPEPLTVVGGSANNYLSVVNVP